MSKILKLFLLLILLTTYSCGEQEEEFYDFHLDARKVEFKRPLSEKTIIIQDIASGEINNIVHLNSPGMIWEGGYCMPKENSDTSDIGGWTFKRVKYEYRTMNTCPPISATSKPYIWLFRSIVYGDSLVGLASAYPNASIFALSKPNDTGRDRYFYMKIGIGYNDPNINDPERTSIIDKDEPQDLLPGALYEDEQGLFNILIFHQPPLTTAK